jgi:hypothetical protein
MIYYTIAALHVVSPGLARQHFLLEALGRAVSRAARDLKCSKDQVRVTV